MPVERRDDRMTGDDPSGIPWAPPYREAEVRAPVVSVLSCVVGVLVGAGLLVGGIALLAVSSAPTTDGINEPYALVIALPVVLTGLLLLGFSVVALARRSFVRQ
ncbi:hypothetical protein [Cellulomonas sp. ICMP 17802]|uniref:hypothetical protein n=1 Tax=Cellulomonas sp. ICMP 17802 TaxID=3239199 RepID=UPI00351AE45F